MANPQIVAQPLISFIPQNDIEFRKGLDRLGKATSDFRIPFTGIGRDFYKSNRQLFTLKGPGRYNPLGGFNYKEKVMFRGKEVTKRKRAETLKEEKKGVGFSYPLLVGRTKTIMRSLLSKSGPGAVFFLGTQTLLMGTDVAYVKYHQSDQTRKIIPQRKVVFISGGPDEIALDSRAGGRLKRWLGIIDSHVEQLLEA